MSMLSQRLGLIYNDDGTWLAQRRRTPPPPTPPSQGPTGEISQAEGQ
jgi:hypothetical protein